MSGKKSKNKKKKRPGRAERVRKAPRRHTAAGKVRPAAKAAPADKGPPSSRPSPKGRGQAAAGTAAASKGHEATAKGAAPAKSSSRKSSRRTMALRRGPDGELLAPGDLLLPGGAQRTEEVVYLFRGCVAAERPVGDEALNEVLGKRTSPEAVGDREDLARTLGWARERFARGHIEPVVPPRGNLRRTFQGVVERAKHRRREIGAFLRGLDLGRTETSHMDAHGEASLQSLMEWAARLENLTEADEPTQADYNQFHRGLDQLESTTEALMIDVEQTLRRLRDRARG